ncbi:OLC1v1028395C1 [Oldenlandia corymbosa var. corymbosa]|uniref:OLC1v1028395C1 n=1 Tax=Oldenlandia corymbosa var. corymbosa TaxID=529605 RepID=A0AAV1CDK0_OLDCO|nr:OLC1v1028395C1 [Oldenlandia corymbosa var. corymbosa]
MSVASQPPANTDAELRWREQHTPEKSELRNTAESKTFWEEINDQLKTLATAIDQLTNNK